MRGTLLAPRGAAADDALARVRARIAAGVAAETALEVAAAQPTEGWLAVELGSDPEAARFASFIRAENVAATVACGQLLLPVDSAWGDAEVDHVVLATAKVYHYLRRVPRPRITPA